MIVAIDVGNTYAKWKAWKGKEFHAKGKFEHALGDLDWKSSIRDNNPELIVYADVCDSGVDVQLRKSFPLAKLLQVRSSRECMGVVNSYDCYERLGIDRWLAMIESYHMAGKRACCVFDFGTAATVDVVNDKGMHQGGQIVPGLRMLRVTLPKYTGKVRFDAENKLEIGYGVSTVEAVEKGSLSMLVAWANQEVKNFYQAYPGGQVYVTGGTAPLIIHHLDKRVILNDDMVLDALLRVAESNPDKLKVAG